MPSSTLACVNCRMALGGIGQTPVWDYVNGTEPVCSATCFEEQDPGMTSCEHCGESVHEEDMRYNERLGCSACDSCNESNCDCDDCMYSDEDEGGYGSDETSRDDPDAAELPALTVPALADRPARMLSAEIEVGRGGTYLAEKFHTEGLAEGARMRGYHSSEGLSKTIHVEEDGSVAAEVVFQKFRLNKRGDASKFAAGVGVIKDAIRDEYVKLDMRCGLHIHVGLSYDAECGIPAYGMDSVASLHHLWNYLEDTIFRIASANWKGHRSEFGNDYAPKNFKGASSRREIGRMHNNSRGALNLSNYLGARGYCRCGAFDFGEWSECTCDMTKATVEFRVFNTSANTRKLRAYAALCQALVAYAERNTITAESHPALEWAGDGYSRAAGPNETETMERLKFIFRELPLTNDEKQDLLYCAEKSSLNEVMDRNLMRVDWQTDRQPLTTIAEAARF